MVKLFRRNLKMNVILNRIGLILTISNILCQPGDAVWIGSVEDTEANINHLKILSTSLRFNLIWLGTDIVNQGPFHPWDFKVQTLGVSLGLDAAPTGKFNCTVTTVN